MQKVMKRWGKINFPLKRLCDNDDEEDEEKEIKEIKIEGINE